MTLAISLAGCASAGPDGGVATYDALRQARDACTAKSGTFRLKTMGNSQYLEDYACERK